MSITITDPALLAQFAAASGAVELRDPSGQVIGTLVRPGERNPRVKSPISDEEFEEARKQTGGRPLADILRDLEEKHGRQ
jgi:hypothetical protein